MQYQHLTKFLSEEELNVLQSKTVSVVGLGGIGSSLAEMMVRSGINVRVIEKDRVFEEDLDRLSLFEHKHISKFKATEAKKILNRINPEVQVKSFNEEVTVQSLFLIDADLVLDCSGDNDLTPLISSYCSKNDIPHVAGGIRDTQGIVIVGTKKKTVQDHLDAMSFQKTEGLVPSASRVVASMMYVKAIKSLLDKKDKKDIVIYDLWKQEIVKPGKSTTTKKSTKKKSTSGKTSTKKPAKKTPKKKSSTKRTAGTRKKSTKKTSSKKTASKKTSASKKTKKTAKKSKK